MLQGYGPLEAGERSVVEAERTSYEKFFLCLRNAYCRELALSLYTNVDTDPHDYVDVCCSRLLALLSLTHNSTSVGVVDVMMNVVKPDFILGKVLHTTLSKWAGSLALCPTRKAVMSSLILKTSTRYCWLKMSILEGTI